MKTFKDIIWFENLKFGAVELDNDLVISVEVHENIARPYVGIVYRKGETDVAKVRHFDFATEQSLDEFMKRLQKDEVAA